MTRLFTAFSILSLLLSFTLSGPVVAQEVARSVEDENPRARIEYEINRLKDPKTGTIPYGIREKELAYARTLPTREALRARTPKGGAPLLQTLAWSPRGPVNVGGRTRALGVDVTNENIILAGGVSGGMWRSTDGGGSWTLVSGANNLHSVTCIAQDTRPGHTATWYYGTGELVGNSAAAGGAPFRGDGYYKSTDNGVTWTKLVSTSSGTPQNFDSGFDYTWNVVVDHTNLVQDVVYAATFGAISRSTNGGSTWTKVLGSYSTVENNGTAFSRYSDIVISPTGVLYAAMSQQNSNGTTSAVAGIWRSTDGINWTNITSPSYPLVFNRVVLGLAPSNETILYVLAETPGSGHHTTYAGGNEDHSFWKYTYGSGDGTGFGGAWEDRSANLPAFGQPVGEFASQGGYDLFVKVRPDNEDIVFLGGTDLWRSTNGFADNTVTAWIGGYATANNVSVYPNHHPDQHALVFSVSNPAVMWSGNDGGVQKTTNNLAASVSWSWLNNGYETAQFYSVALDHGTPGDDVVVGGTQDNGTWFTNNGNGLNPWLQIRGGDGTYCAIADGRTSYYVSVPAGNTYRFLLNGGGGLTGFTRVDPTGGGAALFVDPFILDPNNTSVMYYAGGTKVWRNSDLTGIPLGSNSTTTTNWTSLTNTNVAGSNVTAFALSKSPANRLYYGRDNGHVYRLDNAIAGNPLPVDVTGAGFPAGGYVASISVDPSDADRAVVAFSNYLVVSLFLTTDAGASWSAVAGNLEQNPDGSGNGPSVHWVTLVPGACYAATSTGLYSTGAFNGSSTVWAQEGSAVIGAVPVDMIDFRASDGRMVVGTHGGGIFSSTAVVIPPGAPALVFPPDSAQNQLTSLPMRWTTAQTATSYDLEVSLDSLFLTDAYRDSTIADTVRIAGPFANFTTHFWRVRAMNAIGWGPFSSPRRFTTGFTGASLSVATRWNLVSVPVTELDYRRSALFPSSISPAFLYAGASYAARETLDNRIGYWLKFPSDSVIALSGVLRAADTIAVAEGWNLVGSISDPVAASDVESEPPGIIASSFFAYDHGYRLTDTVLPLRGHWVKTSAAGTIILSSGGGGGSAAPRAHRPSEPASSTLGAFNALAFTDAAGNSGSLYYGSAGDPGRYELPPSAPEGGFDLRFAAGSLLASSAGSHRIQIQGVFPVTVRWSSNRQAAEALLLLGGGREASLRSPGSVVLTDPSAQLTLRLGGRLPADFTLGQNYPNPFNPSTKIAYDLPVDARVTLTVYTMLGQKVAVPIQNALQSAGSKSFDFNASGLASGIYFYRLDAAGTGEGAPAFSAVRKMILMR